MTLWTLRYRKGAMVQTSLIEAANAANAEAVGRAWCGKTMGLRYIGVELAVVATEAILPVVEPTLQVVPAAVDHKPTLPEQRKRAGARASQASPERVGA